jgi:hypothetical protein
LEEALWPGDPTATVSYNPGGERLLYRVIEHFGRSR